MLLDPFEEQFDLPAAFVELGNGYRRQREIIGQENKAFLSGCVKITNPSELFWIILFGIETFEGNDLIADNPDRFVNRIGIETFEMEITFRSGKENGHCLVNGVGAMKIEVTAVKNIERPGFEKKLIDDVDIMDLALRNFDHRGNASPQIQKRVLPDCRLVFPEFAQGKRERQRSIVVESRAYTVWAKSTPNESRAYRSLAWVIRIFAKSA